MKIIQTKVIEDCIDRVYVREFLFDKPIDKAFIDFISQLGRFEYYSEFSKPLFKVSKEGSYTIKGLLGNMSIRLIFEESGFSEDMNVITKYIEGF